MPGSGLFLDKTELGELTGYRTAKRQIAWLRSHAWKFELTGAGAPRVARAFFERRMVGQAVTAEPTLPAKHHLERLRVVK